MILNLNFHKAYHILVVRKVPEKANLHFALPCGSNRNFSHLSPYIVSIMCFTTSLEQKECLKPTTWC